MDTLQMKMNVYLFLPAGFSRVSAIWSVEGGCRRLELGVGLISFPQNLLGFITSQTLLSFELE